ncbi:MAG: response regulator [Herbinix sp.]|nr:response regulator [Herbinix sp.]
MEKITFKPPNILVVDDVSANLIVLSEIIRNAGYIPRPVNNVQQAIYAIEALPPNLIILDVSMPDMDGITFCSILKKNAATRDIPVIFISALASMDNKVEAYEMGAVDYITKPFDSEDVTMRINTQIRLYHMQQDLEANNRRLNRIVSEQIHKIYNEQKNIVRSLTILCMKMNAETSVHMDRIGKNARLLSISLQISQKFHNKITSGFIDMIELTAPLHNIGVTQLYKMNCFRHLNNDEKDMVDMKQHTVLGANILEDIYSLNDQNEFIKMAIDIAKYHHENWNGSGYPIGLSGEYIPLCARIVSVVNAYDNLITENKNQLENSHEICIKIINEGSGILYDPDIVTVLNKIQYQLEK